MKSVIAKLDVETLILDTSELSDEIGELQGYQYRKRDTNSIEVEIPKGQGVNQLFDQLNEKNITVLSLRNKTNRLEELFVRLVENKSSSQ